MEEVVSPCIGVCVLDEEGSCTGCLRSAAEITNWLAMSPDERDAVMDQLPNR